MDSDLDQAVSWNFFLIRGQLDFVSSVSGGCLALTSFEFKSSLISCPPSLSSFLPFSLRHVYHCLRIGSNDHRLSSQRCRAHKNAATYGILTMLEQDPADNSIFQVGVVVAIIKSWKRKECIVSSGKMAGIVQTRQKTIRSSV